MTLHVHVKTVFFEIAAKLDQKLDKFDFEGGVGGRKIVSLLFDSKSNAIGPRSIRGLYAALERFLTLHVHVKTVFFEIAATLDLRLRREFLHWKELVL